MFDFESFKVTTANKVRSIGSIFVASDLADVYFSPVTQASIDCIPITIGSSVFVSTVDIDNNTVLEAVMSSINELKRSFRQELYEFVKNNNDSNKRVKVNFIADGDIFYRVLNDNSIIIFEFTKDPHNHGIFVKLMSNFWFRLIDK